MQVELTRHAELQVTLRKLDRLFVEEVASNPEQVIPAGLDEGPKGLHVDYKTLYWGQTRYARGGREHLLRVLFQDITYMRVVLTVYTTSKVAKYWGVER